MGNECNECKQEHRIRQLEDAVKILEEHNVSLLTTNAVFTEKFEQIITAISKLEIKLDTLTERPRKKWDILVASLIQAVAVVIVGILFAN